MRVRLSARHDRVFVEQVCFEIFVTFSNWSNTVAPSKLLFVSKPPCFRQSFKHSIIILLSHRRTTKLPPAPSAHRLELSTKSTCRAQVPNFHPQHSLQPSHSPHRPPVASDNLTFRPSFLSTSLIPLLHSSARRFATAGPRGISS